MSPNPARSTRPARIALTGQGLRIDGRTRLLYGGEVQYYRLRDAEGDAARTERIWAQALDQLVACGMNVVTTYVPWDYHELRPGRFDFSGPRNLTRFLELCAARELPVILKPGPFINSEWPTGVGSFGAIPAWFRAHHQQALARRPEGGPFSTDPLGRGRGYQPSLSAPELRRACAAWFKALAPTVRRFVDERVVFGLQLDNETNLYFASRYWADHSPAGIKHWRSYLAQRYASVEELNRHYGSDYAGFNDVAPPSAPPRRHHPVAANRLHDDWFAAAQAGFAELHGFLRATWEGLGVKEPDVLFLTNDSPHTFPGRDLCLWDGRAKNAHGLACLDSYPRQWPTSGRAPADLPWLTALFSKRFQASNDRYRFARDAPVAAGKCYALELEGGLFELPLLQRPVPVPAASTDLVLLQHLGRGSALAVVYVFRAGLNRDNTPYFGNAAVDVAGRPQERYEVLRRYGRLVSAHGEALLKSAPAEAAVALLVDGGLQAPAGGVATHPGQVQVDEACAVFGWLEHAGLDPTVIDLRDGPLDLDPFRLVVLLDPGRVPEFAAREVARWTRAGGVLLHLLGEGAHGEGWRRGTDTEESLSLGLLAEGRPLGERRAWPLVGAKVQLELPEGTRGPLSARPFVRTYALSGGAEPLAFARGVFGLRGDPVAWRSQSERGWTIHFGTNPAALFGSASYYRAPRGEVLRARALARWLASLADVAPVVSVAEGAGSAWGRRGGAGAFLFVSSRLSHAARLRVQVTDPVRLGLRPTQRYRVQECLSGAELGETCAASLRQGLPLRVAAYGAAVVRLTPAERVS